MQFIDMFSTKVLSRNQHHEGSLCNTKDVCRICLIVYMFLVMCSSSRTRTPHTLSDHWRGTHSDEVLINKTKNNSSFKTSSNHTKLYKFSYTVKETAEQTTKPSLYSFVVNKKENKVHIANNKRNKIINELNFNEENNFDKDKVFGNVAENDGVDSFVSSSAINKMDDSTTHKTKTNIEAKKRKTDRKLNQRLHKSENIPRNMNGYLFESQHSATNSKVSVNSIFNSPDKVTAVNKGNLFGFTEIDQHQQKEDIDVEKSTEGQLRSTTNDMSFTKNPVTLKNVEDQQHTRHWTRHQQNKLPDNKIPNFSRPTRKMKNKKVLSDNKNRRKKMKAKTKEIRNKSLMARNKENKEFLGMISTSRGFYREKSTGGLEESGESRESFRTIIDQSKTRNGYGKRELKKTKQKAKKQRKVGPPKRNLRNRANFRPKENSGETKIRMRDSKDVTISPTDLSLTRKHIKVRFSSRSPMGYIKRRKLAPHSLHEHDISQAINNSPLLRTKLRLKITLKQTSTNLTPPITINSNPQDETSNFEGTTQSKYVIKTTDSATGNRFHYSIKESDIATLHLHDLKVSTPKSDNFKGTSKSGMEFIDSNEKEYDKFTNEMGFNVFTKSAKIHRNKISSDLYNHQLTNEVPAAKLISTASNEQEQRLGNSFTGPDTDLKRDLIQFKSTTPLNSDFTDESYDLHKIFPFKTSLNPFFIPEMSSNPTDIHSSEMSSLKYLHQSTLLSKIGPRQVVSQTEFSSRVPSVVPTKLSEDNFILETFVPKSSATVPGNYMSDMSSEITSTTSAPRRFKDNKSSSTAHDIKEFIQTSIPELFEINSQQNLKEHNHRLVNQEQKSQGYFSTLSPNKLFMYTTIIDRSDPSKPITKKKPWLEPNYPTTAKNEKTKFVTSVLTTEVPTYFHDLMTTISKHRNTSLVYDQPVMTSTSSSKNIRTSSISSEILKPTSKNNAKPTRKATSDKNTHINAISDKETLIHNPTLPPQPHSMFNTQYFSTRRPSYFSDTFARRHTTSQIRNTSIKMVSLLTAKTPFKHTPHHFSTIPPRHTLSQTRKTYLPSTKISNQIKKSKTKKTTHKTLPEIITKISTPFKSTRNFPNQFETTTTRPKLTTTVTPKFTTTVTLKLTTTMTPKLTHKTHKITTIALKKTSKPPKLTTLTSKRMTPRMTSKPSTVKPKSTDTTHETHKHKQNKAIQSEATEKTDKHNESTSKTLKEHLPKHHHDKTHIISPSSSTAPSKVSGTTFSQKPESSPSPGSDRIPHSKIYQRLLVVCKVDTYINIESEEFQNNIRGGLVRSYIEGKALGYTTKSGSMKKRRKRSIQGMTDQVQRIKDITFTKCAKGCKTESGGVKAVIIRQVRRDTLVSIYFQMEENGTVVEAEKAAEIFSRLQLTEISVHLKYAIFEKVRIIKTLLPQSQHPLKSSSTKWMIVTIAAPSIPVLCVVLILLSSWYRNYTRLRQKAIADISRGSGYSESLADVGLEIDMEKGEIVSRAGSTSVLWSEDFIASANKDRNSHTGYVPPDAESSRSNSWSAYADPNNVFNSLRNKKRSPIPRRYQRQGKYAKKHSASSFNFETGSEDECSPIYESFKPVLGRYKWPYTSSMQSTVSGGRMAKDQQWKNDTSTSKTCSETSNKSQMLRLSLHANIISQFLAELENM
ncbi:hypothetical protein Ahia01_000769600 [Argonauta hians]